MVFLSGMILLVAAFTATLFSLLASMAAYIIIRLVVWQESEFLVKCTSIFGTKHLKEEEMK